MLAQTIAETQVKPFGSAISSVLGSVRSQKKIFKEEHSWHL